MAHLLEAHFPGAKRFRTAAAKLPLWVFQCEYPYLKAERELQAGSAEVSFR